jgi:regulator of replication initiation timing
MIAIHCGTDRENTPLIEQLISRNEDLQAERLAALADNDALITEKMAVIAENDALTAENAQLRTELAAKHREVA